MENTIRNRNGFLSFFKKFTHHKIATAAAVIFLIEVLCIIFLPMILHLDDTACDFLYMGKGPNSTHLLGTDEIGHDILARIIVGGRVSLVVGFASTAFSACIGVPLGVIAGYYQGKIGDVILRIADMFMSFPSMVLTLVLVAVMGGSIGTLVFAIGILGWTRPCRLLYGSVRAVRNSEYVEAAIAIGTRDANVMFQYVIPNAISPLWVSIAFSVSSAIITESSLSFLGIGIQAPQSSWGNIINAAKSLSILTNKVWMWIPASIVLLITVVCINLIGEGIRDALDPKMKG